MKRSACAIIMCILLMPLLTPAAWARDEPLLAAQNAILADMDTGAVLFEQNADERCAPESLTKIMTVLLAVEAIEAGEATRVEYVTAEEGFLDGLDDESSNAGIQLGERLRFEELLYCAMLSSSNESCHMLAVRLAGSVEAFAEKMNTRARELGCENTHFSNPGGLSSTEHYTTARDLLLIAREAMSHELFAEICGTAEYTVPATNLGGKRELENTNALLNPSGIYGAGYTYDGVFGVKTGYTDEAGYCLVSAVERGGVRLMAVVLGCAGSADTGYGSFSESVRLYDWAFERFENRVVLDASQGVWTGAVAYGRSEVTLYPARELALLLPPEGEAQLDIAVEKELLTAPIAAGARLGTATVRYGGAERTVELVTKTPVERDRLQWAAHCLVTSVWFYPVAVLIALAAAYVISQKAAARRRRRRRRARSVVYSAPARRSRR